ncbi:superoxide dismutase [Nocardioides convexus]|uniref:superoxide dismutase n=1 Tax=Nocardioides convexus TaxID=2712224 RepID=UPI00241887A4|nr:superoxide dismutase [Nocardioides convexus]
MSVYALPDLPYDYAALEPYLSGEIMEPAPRQAPPGLCHRHQHRRRAGSPRRARRSPSGACPRWRRTSPSTSAGTSTTRCSGRTCRRTAVTSPPGSLAAAIDEFFGGFDAFRAHFQANALGVQGSGWSVLTWDTLAQRPYIIQHFDHQGNVPICMTPLLMLDMWEHTYYLQYRNDKATFVQQWWNVVNWADVQRRFEAARAQTPGLIG